VRVDLFPIRTNQNSPLPQAYLQARRNDRYVPYRRLSGKKPGHLLAARPVSSFPIYFFSNTIYPFKDKPSPANVRGPNRREAVGLSRRGLVLAVGNKGTDRTQGVIHLGVGASYVIFSIILVTFSAIRSSKILASAFSVSSSSFSSPSRSAKSKPSSSCSFTPT